MPTIEQALRFAGGGQIRPRPTVIAGPTLASPSLTAGWATFGVPLAQGDLPSGSSLRVGDLDTQTDFLTTWPDGSAKLAVVTCDVPSGDTYDVATGTPASGSFTPTVPSASVSFTVYDRFTLLGDFSITSGTLNVTLRNITQGGSRLVADAIYIEAVDGSGTPTGTTYVVDNADGSPDYVESGTWGNGGSGYLSGANCGVGHSVRISTDNTATATWQKTGLTSGTYRISASWVMVPGNETFGASTSTKVGYEILDDDASLGEVTLSQVWHSGEVGGTTLGDFSITSGTCNVRLGNDTASSGVYAAADKVAIYKDGALVAQKSYGDAGITLSGFAGSSGYAATNDQSSSTAVYLSACAPGGTNTVNYQFTGLDSGTYRVVVWQPWGQGADTIANGVLGTPFATDAPWTVLDDGTSRGTVDVNQKIWSGRSRPVAHTATLSGSVGDDVYLDGALCKEWRRIVAPVDDSAVEHPALRVLFDVRCYADGGSRVQVTVENCFNKARVKEVYYDVEITVDSASVFSKTMVEQFCSTRWTKIFTVDATESVVTPDFSRANSSAAKLLPRYADGLAEFDPGAVGLPSGGNARWDILRPGGISQYNMYTGDVNYVGPYPTWVSSYLVNFDADSREYMLETARNSYGAYPVHFRHTDNTVLDPEANATFWPDNRASASAVLFDPGAINRLSTRHFLAYDLSHNPQALLVPFMLTGERYLSDEMAFWITGQIVGGNNRLGAEMILQSTEARAMGWSLRTVAENTALLPDSHEAKVWGATCVANTVAWHEDYAAGEVNWLVENEAIPNSPVAYAPFTAGNGSDITGGLYPRISANWQNIYILYAIQRSRDLGLCGSTEAANAVTRLIAYSLGLFGGQQTGGSESDPAVSTYPRDANLMLLINQGFDAVCTDDADYAKNWNVQVGTAGTHVVVGSRADSYGQLGCLKLVSDGSTLASVYQQFNTPNSDLADAGGTADTLANSVSYYLITWMKISATDTTGTVILELVDDSGTVHNSNQFTVDVDELTTSYARKVFTITTATLPGVYRLRIRFGSSPTSGREVFFSPVVMYRVPSSGNRVQATGFYTTVGFNQSGTTTYFTDWDGLFAGALAGGRASAMIWPSENNWSEHALALNIAERLGLSGATAAYDACVGHPNFANRDNFKFIRGMYE